MSKHNRERRRLRKLKKDTFLGNAKWIMSAEDLIRLGRHGKRRLE